MYKMDIGDSLHALLLTHSRFITLVSSFIARLWSGFKLNDDHDLKLSSVGCSLLLVLDKAHRSSINLEDVFSSRCL